MGPERGEELVSAGEHTPAPWFAVLYGDGSDTVICKDQAGMHRIAFMAIPGTKFGNERRNSWGEIRANARLIVASPELLAEAEANLEAWENVLELGLLPERHRHTARVRVERLRAVIAKARGRT
jgi:hypothetical protein